MQTVDVEAVRGLGRTCGLGIGTARVLQVNRDAAVLVDRENVPIGLSKRQYEPRQPQHYLSKEWPVGEVVCRRVARLNQSHPDPPIASAHQVVWIARQIVE